MFIKPYKKQARENFENLDGIYKSQSIVDIKLPDSLHKPSITQHPALGNIKYTMPTTPAPTITPKATPANLSGVEFKDLQNVFAGGNFKKFRKIIPSQPTEHPHTPPSEEIIESFQGSQILNITNDRILLKSIGCGLIFYILANPRTLKLTEKYLPATSDKLAVHTLVFMILVYFLTLIK